MLTENVVDFEGLRLVGPTTDPQSWTTANVWNFQFLSELYRTAAVPLLEILLIAEMLKGMASRENAPLGTSHEDQRQIRVAGCRFLELLRGERPTQFDEACASARRINGAALPLSQKLAALIESDEKMRRWCSGTINTYVSESVGIRAEEGQFLESIDYLSSRDPLPSTHPNPEALMKCTLRKQEAAPTRKERRRAQILAKKVERRARRELRDALLVAPLQNADNPVESVIAEVDWERAKRGLGCTRDIQAPADTLTYIESQLGKQAPDLIGWSPQRLDAARKSIDDPERRYAALLRERFDAYREVGRGPEAYLNQFASAIPDPRLFNPDCVQPRFNTESEARDAIEEKVKVNKI